MTAELMLPESVRQYAIDPAIRSAIVTLLHDRDAFVSDLDRADLPNYYRATLAAHHFVADWGVFGGALWDATWQEALRRSSRWTLLSVGEVIQEEWSITPDELWSDDMPFFGWIAKTEQEYWLWTGLKLDQTGGLRLVVSFEDGATDPFASFNLNGGSLTQDAYENWVSSPLVNIDTDPIDVGRMEAVCQQFVEFVDEFIDAQLNKKPIKATRLRKS